MGITHADIMMSPNPLAGGQSGLPRRSGWSMLSMDWQKSIVPVSYSVLLPYWAQKVHVALFVMFWRKVPERCMSGLAWDLREIWLRFTVEVDLEYVVTLSAGAMVSEVSILIRYSA